MGFATAIGVHPLIGYTDFSHLAPAFVGFGLFVAGLWLSYAPIITPSEWEARTIWTKFRTPFWGSRLPGCWPCPHCYPATIACLRNTNANELRWTAYRFTPPTKKEMKKPGRGAATR